jgi:deoxyguanosine kinase
MLARRPGATASAEPVGYTRCRLECRYIALEGPAGVGKGTLAARLASRLDAALVLDETESNPFLGEDHVGRPGSAFQAQLFCLLGRHRQQVTLRQGDLFSHQTISDYLFDRDKIYAFQTLDDNELFIYQRLFDLLARDVPQPDLVVFLQAPTDVLRRRLKEQPRREGPHRGLVLNRLAELNEAFNHFFFHYTATPLLVVETSQIDLAWPDAALDDLLRQIQHMHGGKQYYVPRNSA